MDGRWQPGDAVALREIWRGRIWTARAATVVDDGPDRTMFYIAPGMRWKCPIHPGGAWQRLPSDHWVLGDRIWERYRVLSFAWPDVAYAVLVYWNASDGAFAGWYVNLQTPLTRSKVGFDYMDHTLDIEVHADRTWSWKDADELAEGVERGLFTRDEAREIRTEGERAIRRLETRTEPFDDEWIAWRPDPSWPVAELPPGWDVV